MPYKFEKKKIRKEDDKRVKLTDEDKALIKSLYEEGQHSQRELAAKFGVSRRSIVFAIYPERLEQNYQRRLERGGHKIYYDTEKNREYMQRHRLHKKELDKQNKLKE